MRKFFNLFLCFFLGGCAAQIQASKGWKLLDQGKPDEAIEKFEKSKTKEELPGYFLGMYQAYLLKKDLNIAKSFLDQGVDKYPDDFHLNFTMGNYYLNFANKPSVAKQYFEKCKSLKPGSASDLLEEAINEAESL